MNPTPMEIENRRLRSENARLRAENERLTRESSEYLSNWIAAQDLAYNRLVTAAIKEPAPHSFASWLEDLANTAAAEVLPAPRLDIILRPTTLKPGIYEDDTRDAFMVVVYKGASYVWLVRADGDPVEPGDIVLKNVVAKKMTVTEGVPGT